MGLREERLMMTQPPGTTLAQAERQRDLRNQNPTPAARVAMIMFGDQYMRQRGGSMDFWDSLSADAKHLCELVVLELKKHS